MPLRQTPRARRVQVRVGTVKVRWVRIGIRMVSKMHNPYCQGINGRVYDGESSVFCVDDHHMSWRTARAVAIKRMGVCQTQYPLTSQDEEGGESL